MRLHNKNGKTSDITIGAEERSNPSAFAKKVNAKDGFMYRLPPVAGFHSIFMYYIEKNVSCPVINKTSVIGKYKDKWLFDEFGIDKRGNVVIREDSKYTLDGEHFAPPIEALTGSEYRVHNCLPVPAAIDEKEAMTMLWGMKKNYGGYLAWAVLGWISACFIKDRIQGLNWGFPVCYITGNSESGKTTLAKWCMKLAGFLNTPAIGAKSTVFGINKLASVYSNLPLWFDDIRGLGEDSNWNTIILGAYENAGNIKGTKDQGISSEVNYKSGLLITSEFFVKSPAAQSRCIQLEVDPAKQDRKYYKVINTGIDAVLPYLGVACIKRIAENKIDIDELLYNSRDTLIEAGMKPRYAQNFACLLAGFDLLTYDFVQKDEDMHKEYVEYLVEIGTGNLEEVSAHNYANEIIKDLCAMTQENSMGVRLREGEDYIVTKDKWKIKTTGLYEKWVKFKGIHNVGDFDSRREFIVQLRRTEFSERNSNGTTSIQGKIVPAVVLNLWKIGYSKDIELNTIPGILQGDDISEFI